MVACTRHVHIYQWWTRIDEDQEDEFDMDEMERVQSVNHSEEIYDCFVQAK